tara:strand:+ start:17 stop:412 length:396 start_codon:yes stop_codon:yes gene_type:complete
MSATITLPMGSINLNTSLQVGDIVYFSPTSDVIDGGFDTGFNQSGSVIYELGTLVSHTSNSLTVIYDDTIIGCPSCDIALPAIGDFIMFQKEKQVNNSSVLGYYMNATFKNFSRGKIELFSVGSEVSESSK